METTIGLDLGDTHHYFCMLDPEGAVMKRGRIGANLLAVRRFLSGQSPALVAMEAGTHSPWISCEAREHGHRVLVGNPRKLRMIYRNMQKCEWKPDEKDVKPRRDSK